VTNRSTVHRAALLIPHPHCQRALVASHLRIEGVEACRSYIPAGQRVDKRSRSAFAQHEPAEGWEDAVGAGSESSSGGRPALAQCRLNGKRKILPCLYASRRDTCRARIPCHLHRHYGAPLLAPSSLPTCLIVQEGLLRSIAAINGQGRFQCRPARRREPPARTNALSRRWSAKHRGAAAGWGRGRGLAVRGYTGK
jgi:hypothetical protein